MDRFEKTLIAHANALRTRVTTSPPFALLDEEEKDILRVDVDDVDDDDLDFNDYLPFTSFPLRGRAGHRKIPFRIGRKIRRHTRRETWNQSYRAAASTWTR